MGFVSGLGKYVKSVLDAIFPEKLTCLVCGDELDENIEGLCKTCYEKLPFIDGKTCLKCGQPLENLAKYCNRCQNEEIFYKKAAAVFEYDDVLKNLMFRFKNDNQRYLGRFLAKMLAQKYAQLNFDADAVIYVPLHKKRLKKRGFNQAELLCKNFCKITNMPMIRGNLVKIKDTGEQKFLSKNERVKNLEKSFFVSFRSEIKGKNVLLIDDVMTTGATSNECARVLSGANAKNVYVLCIATVKLQISEEN